MHIWKTLSQIWWEEQAATAMEYGLMLGIVSLILLVSFYNFYDELVKLFGAWGDWYAKPEPTFSR